MDLLTTKTLTRSQFQALSTWVRQACGINLHEGKLGLVQARLAGRLRELGLDIETYLARLAAPGGEVEAARLVDALTTNKTGFFREPRHFDLLRGHVLPELRRQRTRLSVWSAGCSSGEEAYTLAMVLLHVLGPGADVRILATDLSARMLARARQGVYTAEALETVPADLRRYFTFVPGPAPRSYAINPEVKRLVHFARLNLMDPWPMRGTFDLICCRNVMIYFDNATQQRLVQRFRDRLVPGGYLFTGHSESLAGLQHDFRYVQPAVYQRLTS